MAVVSPVLSTEWPFSSSIGPFDAPTYGLDTLDHSPVVHTSNKRRARDIEWENDDDTIRSDLRTKKAKTSTSTGPISSTSCLSVDPLQLQKDHTTGPFVLSTSGSPPGPFEQVISILVDALTSNCKPPPSTSASISASTPAALPEESQSIVLSSTVPESISATVPRTRILPRPTSPLADCEDRAAYVRKTVGGTCAGKIEPSLCRSVLTRNHFIDVRCLDPTVQSKEWLKQLKRLGWEHAHPYYQAQFHQELLNSFDPYSNWVEDDFDYDGTDWSDEEEGEEGEIIEDHDPSAGQTGVWDSGVRLQLPYKTS